MAFQPRQLCGMMLNLFRRTLGREQLASSKVTSAMPHNVQHFSACAKAIGTINAESKQQAERIVPYTLISRMQHTKRMLLSQVPLVHQDLSLEHCGAVAALLNKAGVENILWGTSLQGAYTVPTVFSELSFIVAGRQLQKAVIALESDSFLMSFDNSHAHFHLDIIPGPDLYKPRATVKLYTMEDKLWELPVFGQGVNFTDGPSNNIIFANDTSLPIGTMFQGTGRFPDSVSGVRIPTLHRYVEALILLALREPKALSTGAWVSELVYVVHLVDMDRLSHPAFKQFCAMVLKGGTGFKTIVRQAREALGSRIPKEMHWNDVRTIRAAWG